jgi:hypothetical protein
MAREGAFEREEMAQRLWSSGWSTARWGAVSSPLLAVKQNRCTWAAGSRRPSSSPLSKTRHRHVGRPEVNVLMSEINDWLSTQDERVVWQYRTRTGPWDPAIEQKIAGSLGYAADLLPHNPGWSWEDVETVWRIAQFEVADRPWLAECATCGGDSLWLYMVPSVVKCERIEPACDDHDRDGHPFCIIDFVADPARLLNHLAEHSRFAPGKLMRWLQAPKRP